VDCFLPYHEIEPALARATARHPVGPERPPLRKQRNDQWPPEFKLAHHPVAAADWRVSSLLSQAGKRKQKNIDDDLHLVWE
jgi:hypothetical protein